MEIKKSPKADLERKKPLWFFIALVINISIFSFLLEYPATDSEMSVEKFAKSVENMAETTEMLAAEETAPAPPEKNIIQESTVNEELEVVDNVDMTEILPPSVAGNDSVELAGSKDVEEKPLERKDVITDLKILDELPSYPGGMSKFVKWLTGNLQYPETARKQRLQGTVMASFIIEKDGSFNNLEIKKSLSKECDEEVLRVLDKMEKWTPGKRKGAACRTLFCIPVEFKL